MKKVLFLLLFCSTLAQSQTVTEIAKIIRPKISFRTGQGGQTAVGRNVLLGTAGTGSFDLTGVLNGDTISYNWISIQIVISGTVSSGVITFEGSNDNTTFYSTPLMNAQSVASLGAVNPTTGSLGTTTNRSWVGMVPYRYFRARISTVIGGGGSIQAAYMLKYSEEPWMTLSTFGNTVAVSAGSVTGNAANSGAANGNPVLIAGRAQTGHVTNDIANNDVTTLLTDINNKTVVMPYSIGQLTWNYATLTGGISNSTTAVTMSAAQGAGIRNVLTGIQISIPAALGGTTEVVVRDGAAGTVVWRGSFGAGTIGSWSYEFPTGIRGTANTLLEAACTSAVTGNIIISAQGFWEY